MTSLIDCASISQKLLFVKVKLKTRYFETETFIIIVRAHARGSGLAINQKMFGTGVGR